MVDVNFLACLPFFPPAHHGSFTASVPLIVNGNLAYPYRTLSLAAEVPTGRITVSPSHIVVQPVPLGVTLTAQFMVSIQGFSRYDGFMDRLVTHMECIGIV